MLAKLPEGTPAATLTDIVSYDTLPLTAFVLATVRNYCNFSASVTLAQKTSGYTTLEPLGPTLLLRARRPAARALSSILDPRLAAGLEYILSKASSSAFA